MKARWKAAICKNMFWFSEEHLGDQASIVLGDAIEKLFEDKAVAQKLKEAIAN